MNHLLKLKCLGPEYQDQKKLLDQLHEWQSADIFVAPFSAIQKESGEIFSCCVWSDGVDTLLPRADFVVLLHQGGDMAACADWETVHRVAGALMQETELQPPCYRVTEFPNEQQLQAIGKIEL